MKYTLPKVNPCRQVKSARVLKEKLFAFLGNKCALCSETDPSKLQVDHPNGRDWEPPKFSYYHRLLRYWFEAQQHKVRLLCEKCNLAQRAQHPDGTFYPTKHKFINHEH